jgi:hypothetical protein
MMSIKIIILIIKINSTSTLYLSFALNDAGQLHFFSTVLQSQQSISERRNTQVKLSAFQEMRHTVRALPQ